MTAQSSDQSNWNAHRGIFSSRVMFAMASRPFGAWLPIRGSSPFTRSGVGPDQPHIRSSRFERLHHDSAFGGGAREAGPFFASAFLEPSNPSVRRPGSAEADQSSADEKSGASVGGEIRRWSS